MPTQQKEPNKDVVIISCNRNGFATNFAHLCKRLGYYPTRAASSLAMLEKPPAAIFFFHDRCCIDKLQFVQWQHLVDSLHKVHGIKIRMVTFVRYGDQANAELFKASGAKTVVHTPAVNSPLTDKRFGIYKDMKAIIENRR